MGHYVLDKENNPVLIDSVTEWVRIYVKMNRRVQSTKLPELNASVSTVFLGLDHQWGVGPPILFETMIFGSDLDGYQERYSTWDEAVKGHKIAVELLRPKGK